MCSSKVKEESPGPLNFFFGAQVALAPSSKNLARLVDLVI
jgi:hypothetical protein